MPTRKKCVECEEAPAAFDDPRDPPLDLGECLCLDCAVAAIDDEIGRLEDELDEMKAARKELTAKELTARVNTRKSEPR